MKINQVLSLQKEKISPDKEIVDNINQVSKEFIAELRKRLKKKKIGADVFIGGSLPKGTLIKKNKYDIDVFVRFSGKYKDKDLSKVLGSALPKAAKRVHGSRDYFQLIIKGIIMEIVPVLKISKPTQAENITDLSYFHVNYVLKQIKKNKKLADEIKLGKAFCYAQDCYGAESYIHGFSGYGLELIISHYGSFEKFLKEIIKAKKKIVIDDSKFYKKQDILKEMNEAKIKSPIVLVDPTFKQRNALAGLNDFTFEKFKNAARNFLKKPSEEFFRRKDIKKELTKKHKSKLITVAVKTSKQAGDIAGTKSKKFFEFFLYKLKRNFVIKMSEFDYDEKANVASLYLVLDKKKDEVICGPFAENKKNVVRFKKAHKKTYIKNKRVCVKISHKMSFKDWFKIFSKKEKNIIKEMSIKMLGVK